MQENELKVEQVAIGELKPAEYNPRKWTDQARKGLTDSLEEFGILQPIVANSNPERKGIVIGGNFKLDIATKKGLKTVPVVWVNLSLAKEKALNLRLNKNQGEFDLDLLAGFDPALLADVGFDSKEMDRIFGETDEDDFDGDKEAEAIIVPTSKYGEIYQLGRHRLMCGDASKGEDVAKLMGGGLADCIWTDPPYNVGYSDMSYSRIGRGTIKNDDMSEIDFRSMLFHWFQNYKEFSKTNVAFYCCYASAKHREFEDALNQNGFEVRTQIIWAKLVPSTMWGDYRWKHEPIFYAGKKGIKPDFFGDRKQFTEWKEEPSDAQLLSELRAMVKRDEAGESTVWRLHREMKYDHPTQKPLKLVSIAIRNSSKRDDIVLDLFGGSGSTLIAADQLNRICYCCEIDPKYVDVIIKRWEKVSGEKAIKL